MTILLRLPIGSATHDGAPDNELLAKWGQQNCILWGRVRWADFGPRTHTLSIRAAWGGVEHCHVDGRTIGVDDDNFLILNHGRIYSTSIRSTQPVESLAICFSPRLTRALAVLPDGRFIALNPPAISGLGQVGGFEYIMEALRSLVLHDLDWPVIGKGFAVVIVFGALMVVLSVRSIRRYD